MSDLASTWAWDGHPAAENRDLHPNDSPFEDDNVEVHEQPDAHPTQPKVGQSLRLVDGQQPLCCLQLDDDGIEFSVGSVPPWCILTTPYAPSTVDLHPLRVRLSEQLRIGSVVRSVCARDDVFHVSSRSELE